MYCCGTICNKWVHYLVDSACDDFFFPMYQIVLYCFGQCFCLFLQFWKLLLLLWWLIVFAVGCFGKADRMQSNKCYEMLWVLSFAVIVAVWKGTRNCLRKAPLIHALKQYLSFICCHCPDHLWPCWQPLTPPLTPTQQLGSGMTTIMDQLLGGSSEGSVGWLLSVQLPLWTFYTGIPVCSASGHSILASFIISQCMMIQVKIHTHTQRLPLHRASYLHDPRHASVIMNIMMSPYDVIIQIWVGAHVTEG